VDRHLLPFWRAAAATPIAGRMGDLWGRRKILIAVLALLGAGCTISALAQSLPVLVAGRVVRAIAGAVFPLAFGIIRDALSPAPGQYGHRHAVPAISRYWRRRWASCWPGPSCPISAGTGFSGSRSS